MGDLRPGYLGERSNGLLTLKTYNTLVSFSKMCWVTKKWLISTNNAKSTLGES